MTTTNEAYERALLGSILFDNRELEGLKVSAELFTDERNRKIWSHIEKMRARSVSANILEVSTLEPGLAPYIAALTDSVTHGNTRFYYDELRELAKKRAILTMVRGLSDRIRDGEPAHHLAEYTEQALTSMADVEDRGYRHVSAVLPGLIAMIEDAAKRRGALSGIDTGFPELNQKTNGWQNQTLVVIGARPGAGKTSIALNMATAALLTGKCVGFFSAEMDARSIIKRMVSSWGKVDYKRLNSGLFASGDMAQINDACAEIAGSRLFINDQPAISLRELASEARRMRRREKVDILFIDYLSLVKNERRDIPRHEQVAEISKALKQLARELDIPVIVLSQLTRDAQGARPNLSQLRDSGAVEEDSDIVMLMWNQGYNEAGDRIKVTLIMEKNRNGPCGDIPMEFTPDRMTFREGVQ